MSDLLYPTSLSELTSWQKRNKTTQMEARLRFVHFVILECIAQSSLQSKLSFKGGNALRFIYQNRRSTTDLDFSASEGFPDSEMQIRSELDMAIGNGIAEFGIRARSQKVKRNPKTAAATHPTYQITIGYAFPNGRRFPDFETNLKPLETTVDLEISLNEVVCEAQETPLRADVVSRLKVCTLDDIIAEKLRSLLQQPIRNRHRKQDVLDIAVMMTRRGSELDREKISRFLIEKAHAREIEPKRSSFDEVVRDHAQLDYEQLRNDAGGDFIPFEEAWAIVLGLVGELNLPD